jgi:flagellar FliL protein
MAEQNVAQGKGGGNLWGSLTALMTALNLVALGGVAYFMQDMWAEIEQLHRKIVEVSQPELAQSSSPVGKELQPQNLGVLYPLEGFLVNLSSNQGPKFLQAQMELELDNPSVEEELIRKKAAIRDSVIALLSSHSYKTLRQPAGISDLRDEVRKKINNLLSTGKIKQVYFTQFHFN